MCQERAIVGYAGDATRSRPLQRRISIREISNGFIVTRENYEYPGGSEHFATNEIHAGNMVTELLTKVEEE